MSAFVSNADIRPSGVVPCFRNTFRRGELARIGEPPRPPETATATARGPPAWVDTPVEVDQHYDPLAQPEPEIEFDQRVQW